jgi:signal transduction histidine kinase/ActR/RegA family two-component response regulator
MPDSAGGASNQTENSLSLAERVRREQIRALYEELPFSALGMTIGGLIVVAGLWQSSSPRALMILWLGLIAANQSWRLLLYRRFQRADPAMRSTELWGRRWALGAFYSGLTWGSSALFMFDAANANYQAYLVICLVGVTAGALALVTIDLRSFFLFVVPTLLPITARLVAEADRLHLWMAAVCTLVLCVLIKFGLKLNRELEQSLYNRFLLDDERRVAEIARNEAEAATQAKSKFLQATSHDLRNDVQAISLLTDQLGRADLDSTQRGHVAVIAASARTVGRLADDLLSVSRLDAGDIRPCVTAVGLQALFDSIEPEFGHLAAQQGIALRIHPSPLAVKSDPMLLERMLRNLVSNAVRYTRAGGSVEVAAHAEAGEVRIEVRDTGIGIAAHDQQRIFDEFYQVAGRASSKGLGIGLSIVQRFAELLGHRLTVESTPGRGSIFSIRLARTAKPASEPVHEPVLPNPLRGRVALLVDDDGAILGGLADKLRSWELEVFASTDADEALAAMADARCVPALIVADYQLGPNENGIALVDRVRSRFAIPIPALLVTGYSGDEHRAPAAARGIRILDKPVRLAQLRLALEDAIKIELAPT